MDQLRRLGHQPYRDAGAAADEGGQHDQPDLVGADQRAQRLRRMQHRIAERAARTMRSEWTQFSPRAGPPGAPAMVESPGSVDMRDVQRASENETHSWDLRAAGSTAVMPICHEVW